MVMGLIRVFIVILRFLFCIHAISYGDGSMVIVIGILKWFLFTSVVSLTYGAVCATVVPIMIIKICRRFNLAWKGNTLVEMFLGAWLYLLVLIIGIGLFTGDWGALVPLLTITTVCIMAIIYCFMEGSNDRHDF